jgi:hypothetical protein
MAVAAILLGVAPDVIVREDVEFAHRFFLNPSKRGAVYSRNV